MAYPISEPVEQVDRPRGALRVRPRSKGNYTQHCNIVYAESNGIGLVMDIFEPAGEGNGRGIVDVIAGSWHSDRTRLNEHIGLGAIDAFCAAGFTVFAAAPGSADLFTAARMVAHVHAAIRYVKSHAARWNVDADRLALCGVSAGGHLAALAALDPEPADEKARLPWYRHDTGVAAAGLFFPPADLLDYGGRRFDFGRDTEPSIARLLFSDGIAAHTDQEIESAARAISPLHRIRGGHPSFFVTHATGDAIVPYSQSARFVEALQDAGTEAVLVTHEGEGHPWRGIDRECGEMARWLAVHLAAGTA